MNTPLIKLLVLSFLFCNGCIPLTNTKENILVAISKIETPEERVKRRKDEVSNDLYDSTKNKVDVRCIPLPADALHEVKNGEKYYVKTRIVIEQEIIKDEKSTYTIQQSSDFMDKSILKANELLASINVEIVVMIKEYMIYDTNCPYHAFNIEDYLFDALKYPDYMSIYFIRVNNPGWGEIEGYSVMPWVKKFKYGIMINDLATSNGDNVLIHEIGHYFGLIHTFSEDFVDDTPPQINSIYGSSEIYPNYKNVMNYSTCEDVCFTKGQYDRFLYFLRTYRKNNIMFKKPEPVDVKFFGIDIENYEKAEKPEQMNWNLP